MNDTISRTAAIDLCKAVQKTLLGTYYDPDSAEYISECIIGLEKLPAAQPERKKGKWNRVDNYENEAPLFQKFRLCSCCSFLTIDKYNFCPNCGADMRGEEDETD